MEKQYAASVDEFADRYSGLIDRAEIEQLVNQSRSDLEATTEFPDFLPNLVRKFTRDRLIHLAEDKGIDQRGVQDVLFVCNGNSGRSQTAATFANEMAKVGCGHGPPGSIPEVSC